jgi:hypothetical protein
MLDAVAAVIEKAGVQFVDSPPGTMTLRVWF